MRKLCILILARCVTRGGASRVLMRTAQGLQNCGHKVVLALTQGGVVEDGITPPVPVRRFPRHRPLPGLARIQSRFRGRLLGRWFRHLEAELQPDILYCVDLAEEVLDLGLTSRLPCVEHIHALHLDTLTRPLSYLQKLATVGAAFIVPSEFLAGRLHDCLGVPRDKINVFQGGVSVADLRRRAEASTKEKTRAALGVGGDDAVVVGSGGVNFVKGVDRFVRAADATRTRLPEGRNVRFFWVGEEYGEASPFWRACRALISELNLVGCVEFLGYRDDLIPLLAMADLLAVTSRAESLSLVSIEALTVGVPVVAFPVGGVPEVLLHGGGVVTPGNDMDMFASAMTDLLLDKGKRLALGEAGKRAAEEHFDAAQLLPRLEVVLKDLAGTDLPSHPDGEPAELQAEGGLR